MPIIDCHAHIKGGDAAKREFTGEELVRQADEAGVAKTICFSMSLPSRESNDLTARRIKGFEDRLVPLCHVVPTEAEVAVAELDRAIGDWGWRGIKMHFGEFRDHWQLDALRPVLDKVAELSVPILVDTAYQFDLAREMLAAYPTIPFVIAHFGAPQNEDLMIRWAHVARNTPNCYLDCSFCHTPWKMPEAFGIATPDKVLFGSDAPLYHPLIELAKVRVCHLGEDAERKVLHDNAARVFGIQT
jgi:predicted TIM-barrel fold metal-dependent hydrolase